LVIFLAGGGGGIVYVLIFGIQLAVFLACSAGVFWGRANAIAAILDFQSFLNFIFPPLPQFYS